MSSQENKPGDNNGNDDENVDAHVLAGFVGVAAAAAGAGLECYELYRVGLNGQFQDYFVPILIMAAGITLVVVAKKNLDVNKGP